MADVNSTTTQNQTQQQSQTAPQNQPTQASGTQQQPQTDKHGLSAEYERKAACSGQNDHLWGISVKNRE